jgi:hypothetical protein
MIVGSDSPATRRLAERRERPGESAFASKNRTARDLPLKSDNIY